MQVDLVSYFNEQKGAGVLATADAQGKVNVAVYARPHMLAGDSAAFIMPEKLTWANLQANPHAAYLFQEDGAKAMGLRLYLTLERVESDPARIAELRRSSHGHESDDRHLVIFKVDKVLPLVGAK